MGTCCTTEQNATSKREKEDASKQQTMVRVGPILLTESGRLDIGGGEFETKPTIPAIPFDELHFNARTDQGLALSYLASQGVDWEIAASYFDTSRVFQDATQASSRNAAFSSVNGDVAATFQHQQLSNKTTGANNHWAAILNSVAVSPFWLQTSKSARIKQGLHHFATTYPVFLEIATPNPMKLGQCLMLRLLAKAFPSALVPTPPRRKHASKNPQDIVLLHLSNLKDPVHNRTLLEGFVQVYTYTHSWNVREEFLAALFVIEQLCSADEIMATLMEFADKAWRCKAAKQSGVILVLERAAAALAELSVTHKRKAEEEHQIAGGVCDETVSPLARRHSTGVDAMMMDGSMSNSSCCQSNRSSLRAPQSAHRSQAQLALEAEVAKQEVMAMVEVYMDDHKQKALDSAVLEPAKFHFAMRREERSVTFVNGSGAQWYLTVLQHALSAGKSGAVGGGDATGQWAFPNRVSLEVDAKEKGVVPTWVGDATLTTAWTEMSKPENFGRAFTAIPALNRQVEKEIAIHPEEIFPFEADPNVTNATLGARLDSDAEFRAQWQPMIQHFASFFAQEFFVQKCFETLSSECKPEFNGFRDLCVKIFPAFLRATTSTSMMSACTPTDGLSKIAPSPRLCCCCSSSSTCDTPPPGPSHPFLLHTTASSTLSNNTIQQVRSATPTFLVPNSSLSCQANLFPAPNAHAGAAGAAGNSPWNSSVSSSTKCLRSTPQQVMVSTDTEDDTTEFALDVGAPNDLSFSQDSHDEPTPQRTTVNVMHSSESQCDICSGTPRSLAGLDSAQGNDDDDEDEDAEEKFYSFCYKDEYYTELNVENVQRFFQWLGITV